LPDSLAQIEAIARDTVAGFPEPFRAMAAGVILQVQDWPDAALLKEMGITDPLELTGLYDGIPITEKSVSDPGAQVDIVWLFREPILDELRSRPEVSLAELVAHVTVHEFAHHFGWSDEDIATIDQWWE